MAQETVLWKPVAVVACAAMAFFYVGILHAPSLILRLPPPSSYNEFMIRRFICAGISSIVSIIFCAMILPIRSWEASYLLGIYGIRLDHTWRAVVLPLSLTSLMYAGSFVLKSFLFVDAWRERINQGGGLSPNWIKDVLQNFLSRICSTAFSVLAWRTYVVAPLTEELVFRACMIPLFLCGGIQIYSVIFLCPILFSLAHLNHWMEIYSQQNYSLLKASLAVGILCFSLFSFYRCHLCSS
uniref:intramembrane prenyl-peptidase Rce1 n=1 Tax=Rhizophora mucronata TaxID=61149 RepID=A0A2P2KD51_RHIMU